MMNKSRKVEILYRIAKGQNHDASQAELKELRKYGVSSGEDAYYATRANITNYVSAVDNGYRLSFYDWCMNNLKGDRRRRGSSAGEIAADNRDKSIATIFVGWLFWGIAIYWILDGDMSVGGCAVIGAIVAFILQKCFRRWAMFTLIVLPCILAVLFH